MKKFSAILILAVIFLALMIVSGAFYTVREDQQVILTQFGKAIGEPVTDAGIHFKLPLVQDANVLEKRVLEWDGDSTQMPTRDKLYIQVDTFARWKIDDPFAFYQKLRDERSALSRLDDILGSETRNAVAKHDLVEIIRTDKDRVPEKPEDIGEILGDQSQLDPIRYGRGVIENEINEAARDKLKDFGIQLLDVRFKRVNYTAEVEKSIFDRMISEREQIAERFRSEGAGEAARIDGNRERELQTIESEAYKRVQSVLGKAEAEATRIYAEAYGGSPEREEFYKFTKTLEAYESILDKDTTVILSTKNDLFRFLEGK